MAALQELAHDVQRGLLVAMQHGVRVSELDSRAARDRRADRTGLHHGGAAVGGAAVRLRRGRRARAAASRTALDSTAKTNTPFLLHGKPRSCYCGRLIDGC